MTKQWPTVKLGDVLGPVWREERIDSSKEYRLLGTRWYAGGLFVKDVKLGHEIRAEKLYRIQTGDFVYNRLFAWKGSFAVAGKEDNGGYVSNEFPSFQVAQERADTAFLFWYFNQGSSWLRALGLSSGATPTSRNRLKEQAFLEMTVPLPPLAEQRRIVTRLGELADEILEGRALRDQAIEEVKVLAASALSDACSGKWSANAASGETAYQLLDRVSKVKWPGQIAARDRKPMALPGPPEVPDSWAVFEAGELQERGAILDIQDGNHGGDYPRKSEFGNEGVPFVTAKQIDDGKVYIADAPRLPNHRASKLRVGFAKANDVLLTHNASVGDVAIAPTDYGDFLLGTSATYWRCNSQALEPRYLFYFMQSEHFQGQLQFIMKQTTRNQVSVLKQVNLWICIPPISEQRRLVAKLDAFQAEVDTLKRLQAETAAELDALMPSVLSKAFAGEF